MKFKKVAVLLLIAGVMAMAAQGQSTISVGCNPCMNTIPISGSGFQQVGTNGIKDTLIFISGITLGGGSFNQTWHCETCVDASGNLSVLLLTSLPSGTYNFQAWQVRQNGVNRLNVSNVVSGIVEQ